ncbi:thioredoxin family protein [Hyperthermus butylicus]|uniref:Thioredoxin n=1 Tax=Hyperthermus butylicus (strain DSM 5456 / JCM 9403 / PLM1-5) TaxID=415426 RepID=A2BKP4_HYPBU|nr:thioredoxin family protein [Hyperthermus butylicus]ABM80555.1 Thioredoxin [Hyperthermus butylicus DSM 5456]
MAEEDRELEEILENLARRIAQQRVSQSAEAVEAREPVTYITSYGLFREIICRNPLVVAIFTSPTCPACSVYKPIFYRYAAETSKKLGRRIVFAEVDVYYAPEAAYEAGVMATPTTVIFKKCRPVDGFTGIADEETLHQIVLQHIAKG